MLRKQMLEKEKKAIASKDIYAKNPIFAGEFIDQLFSLFFSYADVRTKRTDLRDILITARTLGLNTKYQIVFDAIDSLAQSYGDSIDFETFLRDLTNKIGSPFTEEGRRAIFTLIAQQGKDTLEVQDIKFVSEQLKYGFTQLQIEEIIHNIAGFDATNISIDKWSKFIQKKIDRRRI